MLLSGSLPFRLILSGLLCALLPLPASAQSLGSVLKSGPGARKKAAPPAGPHPGQPSAPRHDQAPVHQSGSAPPPAPTANQPFQMSLPPGWQAQLTSGSAIVARSADGGSLVVIAPFPVPPNVAPAEHLRRGGATALRAYLPEASISAIQPSRAGRSAALASVQFRSAAGPGRAAVLCVVQGGAGTLYAVAAPAARYDQQRAQLVAILRSFSFHGTAERGAAAPAAAPPRLSFTRFRDPNEGSFTVDVPAGWGVRGGLIRKSTVDVRGYLRMTSPDNQIAISIGDPDIGGFVVPTPPTYGMGGLREGTQYSPGYGNVLTVSRYLPGSVFARSYTAALARLTGASNVRIRDVRERPELSSRLSGIAQHQITTGDASFSAMRNGRETAGYVLAGTKITTMGESSMWWVTTLVGWVAPPEQTRIVDAVLQRVMQTFQVNSAWFGQQQQTTAQTSQIVSRTNDEVSRTISDNYWSRQRVQDRANRNFSDSIRGTVRLRDPDSGEELEGTAGKNYYWRVRNTGAIIGADTPGPPPNVDVTELEQIR